MEMKYCGDVSFAWDVFLGDFPAQEGETNQGERGDKFNENNAANIRHIYDTHNIYKSVYQKE